MDALDLCLSCGAHVADATPYCSSRCLALDQAPQHQQLRLLFSPSPSQSSRMQQQQPYQTRSTTAHSSSASRPAHHSTRSRRNTVGAPTEHILVPAYHPAQQQQQPSPPSSRSQSPSAPFFHLHHAYPSAAGPSAGPTVHPVSKLVSIAEWAQGVWGGGTYGENQEDEKQPPVRRTPLPFKPSSSHSHRLSHSTHPPARQAAAGPSSGSSMRRAPTPPTAYSAPRFALTAQHLAPPAMSISGTITTIGDDDLSIITPPSPAPSSPTPSLSSKLGASKKTADWSVDPWISSPPLYAEADVYGAAHGMGGHRRQTSTTSSMGLGKAMVHRLPERGRSLIRV